MPSISAVPKAAAALSAHHDTRTAAREVLAQIEEWLVDACDAVLLFASFHHRAGLVDASMILRDALQPQAMVAATAESVLANAIELEGRCGMAAIALRIPGIWARAFRLPGNDPRLVVGPDVPARLRDMLGVEPSHRGSILIADPFSTPTVPILKALDAQDDLPPVTVVGGMASGASQPGHNVLICDESVGSAGAVGISFGGSVRLDALVSQGCRPIGQPMVVTKAQNNVIMELGGRPAMQAAQEMGEALPPEDRELLGKGVLLGLVIDEYKRRFGRGDFLVRGLLGGDQKTGAIAAGDVVRTGQTIQFHVRDDRTADEDLRLLLDGQQLDAPPVASLVFTCNGRGSKLFSQPGHDAALVHQRLGQSPLAGFFAAGEIGPVGGRPFLHGHTAVVGVLRS
ncbi:MAG TPA: FIST N-terminal domain-containing protein [Phycisphaerales bacterium]|nr:FIST N-terminal domain-containing protein [Phycisphaerales bacterium]HMP37637.1 FIST N-terminal domain-containing protein [Phycisphaerales bacterium]